jgi:para-aminobenzoate synthetase/4-amino-4-deoxychorismate lyase
MQIIRSIEPEPRGVYCGAIGLVGPPSAPVRARFNVAIRTAVVDTHTGHAVYGVGGGITWQSRAPAEHAEVLAKTAVLRAGRTLAGAGRRSGLISALPVRL